ncbi:MAG: zinc ribbon domain-containing protein [Candidatus Riflebacteria bacterium]|nr:zinc ribbon domain-containing protein [Candidatus Riflebacteria bacterium]
MPMYEFVCNDCNTKFEKLCSIKDDLSKVECTNCKGTHVKKQFSVISNSGKNNSSHSHSCSGGTCSTCSSGCC